MTFTGPVSSWYDRVVNTSPVKRGKPTGASRQLLFVDRDDPSTTPTGAPIYLLVNGWFMHSNADGTYKFPFADNVRPIFLAVHIAEPEMLTAQAVEYLRRHEPIGARDYFTRDLLRANGVSSFFNGCPTLTLDLVFNRVRSQERRGRYFAAHRAPAAGTYPETTEVRVHTDPTVPIRHRGDCMSQAWDYLFEYSRATLVETPLLHCYLPCRAFDTAVTFTHPRRGTDPRFNGIVGIDEVERVRLKEAMLARLSPIVSLIHAGAADAEIYRRWQEVNADISSRDPVVSAPAPVQEEAALVVRDRLPKVFKARSNAATNGDRTVDVVLCFDQNLAQQARVTMRSVLANTKSKVAFWLLTRGVDGAVVEKLAHDLEVADVGWFDFTDVTYKELNLLRHTTVSTMDRLFIPELLRSVDRCAYIDIDVVVLGDIAELVGTDLAGCEFGARKTKWQGWDNGFAIARMVERQLTEEMVQQFRREFAMRIPLNFATFNAGVQVLDTQLMRSTGFTNTTVALANRYGINDQFAMNLYAAGRFAALPPSWNHFPTQEILEKPNLIHYIGRLKPWHYEVAPKGLEWRRYIQDSDELKLVSATDSEWFS